MDKQYRLGALCIVGATIAWSSAGLIARLAATPPATTLFWRSGFAFLFILCQIALTQKEGFAQAFRRIGVAGTAMAVSFAVSMAAFINALVFMRVANVLVFHAASPFFAALLAWVFIRDRPPCSRCASPWAVSRSWSAARSAPTTSSATRCRR